MPAPRRRRLDPSWALDLALAGVCAAALALVLGSAFDPPVESAPQLQPAIGAVDARRNDVRRRAQGRLFWQDVEPDQPIHDADAVYAAEDSDAVIRLHDGTTFTLDERSLVVLRRRGGSGGEQPVLAMELVRGGARNISSPGLLTVLAQGAHISAGAGSSLRVRSGAAGPAVEVARGSATVTAQGGAQSSLAANERLALEDGALQKRALEVALQEPADAHLQPYASTASTLRFRWSPPGPQARCRWQLAASASFQPLVAELLTTRGEAEVTVPGEGLFHWRVLCEGQESEQRSVRFWRQQAPVVISPRPEEVVDLSGGAPLWVSWSRLKQGGAYRLEVARNGDFQQPALSLRSRRPTLKLVFTPEEGRYCLRVRAESTNQAPWSEPACFRAVTRPLLDAPRLLPPSREAVPEPSPAQQGLRLLETLLWSTAYAAQPRSALVLRWERIPGAEAYLLEIAEDRAFTRPVLREQVSVPFFRWRVIARRDYFWRVRAVDAAGREGRYSEVLKIGSELAPPALLSPAAGARLELTGQQPVSLRWEGQAVLARYRVEVAADPGFLTEVSVSETRQSAWELPPGRWGDVWWRVTGVDLDGQPSGTSEVRQLSILPAPPSPAGPPTVRAESSRPTLQLTWSARPVARYEVELACAVGPSLRVVTPADHAELTLPSAGTFSWRVRGLEPETGWSPAQRLEVPLERPALLAPAAPLRLEAGATAVLAWSPVPLAESYELFLLPEDGGGVPRLERLPAGSERLEVEGLPPGRYGWTVRAVAAGGALLSESAPPLAFSVLPRAPAPRPPPTTPPVVATPREVGLTPPASAAPGRRALSLLVLTGAGTAVGWAPSPWLGVELQWRPVHSTLEWGTGLRLSGSEASQRLNQEGWQWESRLVRVPLELTALLAWPLGPVRLDAAAGPLLRLVTGTVDFPGGPHARQLSLEGGGTLRGGVEYRLGPGAVRTELAVMAGTGSQGLIRTPPAGISLALGYRWEAW